MKNQNLSPLFNLNARPNPRLRIILFLALLAGWLHPAAGVAAAQGPASAAQAQVTRFDLIVAMNTQRVSYGLPALIEDPIINAVAQATAETMAANHLATHIGNVSGRVAAAGYGGGAKVWATENIALGHYTIDEIMAVWADEAHMLAVVVPAYCSAGAGVARSADGIDYYVFQAAYTSQKACGEYVIRSTTPDPNGSTNLGRAGGVSQLIVPVKVATPDADGKITHVVQGGQSFWSIAVAYKITIKELLAWNNLTQASNLLIGQKLGIPGPNAKGLATPTPVGQVQTSVPAPDGKVVHNVQPYQTLSTIAQAYGVMLDSILALNRITIESPLQIGQTLLIKPSQITPSPTQRPLTPVEKLTPANDGKYYHTVKSGENLAWIADLYKVALKDLMDWNGLKASSVLQPSQKLLLQVTPPVLASPTPTRSPATASPSASPVQPTLTPTLPATPSLIPLTPTTPVDGPGAPSEQPPYIWIIAGLAAAGLTGFAFVSRKK